jgi:hypothetical protein
MFDFFGNAKRAKQAAYSIAQLLHMLSAGHATTGPKAPERLLLGLGTTIIQQTTGDTRILKVLVPILPNEDFCVTLEVRPGDNHTLLVEGNRTYLGFWLSCRIPVKVPVIGVQGGVTYKVSHQARLLYAACRQLPNVVEARDLD